MSFQNGASRWRDLTNSPPPTITKGKSDSNRLSMLMDKARALVPQDPRRLFDLTTPYRNNPRYNTSPLTIPNRGRSQPSSPRGWGGAPGALPFTRSTSMPAFYGDTPSAAASGYIKGLDPDAEEEEDGGDEEMPAVWQCKLCGTQDTTRLEKGADSQLVCKCGAVAEGVAMIGQDRAGNCPKDKDKTDVGDAPSAHRSQSAPPWSGGDETPEARRRRLQAVEGGTARPHNRQLAASEMLLGQNAVDDQARRDAAEMCRDDGPDRGRGQLLLTALATQVFTKLGGKRNMHKYVQKHIRLEAIRIYQASVRHEQCCRRSGCLFALSQYNSVALAFGISRQVLTELAADEVAGSASSPVTTMSSLTTGTSTRRDAERLLGELQQLELANKCGRTPQMKILSAVSLISKWKKGAERCACDAEWTYMPPELRNPSSVTNCPGEYGKSATVDPCDRTVKLRRALKEWADIAFSTSDLRVAAAHQLDLPRVVQFMIDANMDVEVVAVGLLAATAVAMGKADPTLAVRAHVPSTYKVSASVVEDFIKNLTGIIELPMEEDEGEEEEEEAAAEEKAKEKAKDADTLF